jgi:iron complex outermembrane receptor protein
VNYFQVDESEQLSQEFQLISDTDGPWAWIAGLYYLNEDSTTFHGIPVPVGIDLDLLLLIDGTNETTAYAAFGEASYNFTDKWRFTFGARYNYEEKDTFYIDDRFTGFGGGVTIVSQGDDWNSVTPKVALDWFWRDDIMFYGSITKGFKSGGFNLLAVQPGYDEEEVWSYEIGTKSRFRDGRMQLNASVFYYDYDDLQVGKVVTFQATIQNAAQATIYGAEIEFSTLITDHFKLDWALSLLETEYDEFITQDPAPPGLVVNLAGNDLSRSPPVTSSLSGRYDWQLGGGSEIELWGNWLYVDDQFFTQFNRPNVMQESYNVLNARLSYRTAGRAWRFTLYGENLGDEEYFTNALESGVPAPGVDPVVPQFNLGAPRMWGVQVAYNYGGN